MKKENYYFKKHKEQKMTNNLNQQNAPVELPENWSTIYNVTRFLSALVLMVSVVAFKERVMQPYEDKNLKIIVVALLVTSVLYWIYIMKIKNFILENYENQMALTIMELIGYLSIIFSLVFFYIVCKESSFWPPLIIALIISFVYGVFIFQLSQVRRSKFSSKNA